jgi:hypothetical protein
LHVGSGFIGSSAYFAAVDRYGSPALSPVQLTTSSEGQRQTADRVLLDAGDLAVRRIPSQRTSGAVGCRAGAGPGGLGAVYPVPADGLVLEPRGPASAVTVAARRFGAAPQPLRLPPGGGALLVRPAASQAGGSWFVVVGGARVCRPR